MNPIIRTITAFLSLSFVTSAAIAQSFTAGGLVTDGQGEPVAGAAVIEEGTSNGVSTDVDGVFSLEVRPGARLLFSCIGFADITLDAASEMKVVMRLDTRVLDEVVVTGYTVQRKSDLTGAISVVDIDDLSKRNENNPMKALQGKVPGMNISADGSPSGAATVRIRGTGTLNNNDPLYIIDGVPTKAGMHELNSGDIESVQILKDAASASIYGSRAANGVIVITTKRGKEGKLRLDFDASASVQTYVNRMSVLNSREYGLVMWQAYVNDGLDPNTNGLGYTYDWGYDSSGIPVLNGIRMKKYLDSANTVPAADTDWFKETTRTGVAQNYNISVSRGSDRGNSFFSVNWYDNQGIIRTTSFDRISVRANNDFDILKDKLSIGEHLSFNRSSEVAAPSGFLQNVLQFNPSLPVYTDEGEYAGPVGGYPDRENPVARLERNRNNRYSYWRLFGDAYVNYRPFKGFNIRSTFGLDYSQKYQRIFTYPVTEGNVANDRNAVETKQEHWLKWMWNAVASYGFETGRHRGDVMAGVELNDESDVYFSGYKEGFTNLDINYMWPDAGVGTAQAYGGAGGYSLVSFFGKMNYSFDDRYMASLTLRYDGSSRFGRNNRYALFPSVSLGWRVNNEAFLRDVRWLNDLKLRVSWGQTGNQEISDTAGYTIYVSNYGVNESGGQSYGTSYDISGSNGGQTLPSGYKRNQIGNDSLKWETTAQTNVGLDFAVLDGRLYGNFDWYFKDTSDILVEMVGIAAMGEGSTQWINAGAMQNRGIEFNAGWRETQDSGFRYDITANISCYRNKVTRLPDTIAARGTFGGNGVKSVVGHPMGAQVGYVCEGIFRSQEDIDNHALQNWAGLGRMMWKDLDGDGVITEADQDWIYNPVPDFTYGLNLCFEWKGFDITAFFQGVQGVDIISDLKKETDIWAGLNIGFLNKGSRLLDAWSPSNPQSDIPALSLSDNNNEKRVSSYWVENGSYLKLRTLQLGYNLPEKALKKIRLERLRFYLSGQNLFTVKSRSFTGVDPENPNYGYPIPLSVTLGVNLTF